MTTFMELINDYNDACERMDDEQISEAEKALFAFGALVEGEPGHEFWFMPGDPQFGSQHWAQDDRGGLTKT